MSVLVLGSVNVDLVIRSPRLPAPGETVLGGEFFQAHGGKGANQAVAAARASREPVTFIAAIGEDDFGRSALDTLCGENLVCDYIKQVSEHATGVAAILVDERGENMISVASGANLQLLPSDIDAVPEDVFRQAKVFLTNLESPPATVRRGLERAKAAGLLTILNPAPAVAGFAQQVPLELVNVLTPNTSEAAALAQLPVKDVESAVHAARALQNLGPRAVIVTLGSAGAVVVEKEVTTLDAHRVTAVDTTAAGDALNGALASALSEGRDLLSASRWANAAAALSVTRRGAQPSLPTRAEIESFLAGDRR